MSERQQSPYDSIAGRWLALVERRQQNLIELGNSGRWRHYYTHAQFLDEMRKVLHLRNQWAELAGVPLSRETELQQTDLRQIDLQKTILANSLKQQTRRPRQSKFRAAGETVVAPCGRARATACFRD